MIVKISEYLKKKSLLFYERSNFQKYKNIQHSQKLLT